MFPTRDLTTLCPRRMRDALWCAAVERMVRGVPGSTTIGRLGISRRNVDGRDPSVNFDEMDRFVRIRHLFFVERLSMRSYRRCLFYKKSPLSAIEWLFAPIFSTVSLSRIWDCSIRASWLMVTSVGVTTSTAGGVGGCDWAASIIGLFAGRR